MNPDVALDPVVAARIEAGLSELDDEGNERSVRRAPPFLPRPSMKAPEPTGTLIPPRLRRLVEDYKPVRLPCGGFDLPVAGEICCIGSQHYAIVDPKARLPDYAEGLCPTERVNRVGARLALERKRLAGVLAKLERERGGAGFDGFDVRPPGAAAALDVMRRFSEGRPPARGVYLRGGTALGKTRLFIAAHFTLLGAGVESRYTTPRLLRDLFQRMEARSERVYEAAHFEYANLLRAEALLFDDLGLRGDERFRGAFAEAFKALLDDTAAVFGVSTNLTGTEAREHPDLNEQILSRLVDGAEVVVLSGEDVRIGRARVVTQGAQ